MTHQQVSRRAVVRTFAGRFVLALFVAWAAIAWGVSASYLWTPRGTVGILANYDGTITSVAPGSPAAEAGIAPGDSIDIAATPFASRPKVVGFAQAFAPGERIPLTVRHGDEERSLTLTAVPIVSAPQDVTSQLAALVSTAIFIVVGTMLILFSPSRVTWGFGLYALLCNPVVPALARFPSATAHIVYVFIYDILQNIGFVGLLVFALYFPRGVDRPWRRIVDRLLPLIFVVLAGWTFWIDLSVCLLGRGAQVANVWLQVAFAATDLLTILLITETYIVGPVEDRPRLRWVLIGVYVGLVCNFIGNLLIYTANVALPIWLDNALIAAIATFPLAVGYAIVRHRVIEIDFFVGRAIVYAIFTTALVLIFALVDWLLSRVIEDFRLSLLFDALISIGAAYAIDAVQGRMEQWIDSVLFRGRQIARERLEKAARALRYIKSRETLEGDVVSESHEALGLASVALFRHDGEAYRRVAAVGWPPGTRESLKADDRLVREHLVAPGPVALGELFWRGDGVPHGIGSPLVSVPLSTPRELAGLLLCSGTVHGEALDPEEIRWIEEVANAAAVAYEELDAESLRATAVRLREEVSTLKARLDEAHRLAGVPASPKADAEP